MSEMDLLERLHADVQAEPGALLRARRRLLRRAVAPAVRRRRALLRSAILATAATAAATVGVLAVLVLPGPQGAEPAAAAVLGRAARLAASEPVAGPGQWLHVRLETTRPGAEEVPHGVQERWVPGDPAEPQLFWDSGEQWSSPVERPAIYTDADASVEDLYAWLKRDSGDLRGDDAAFERASEVMFDFTAPAAFKARLLEAIALIDGVEVVDRTRFHGHPAVVLGRTEGASETRFVFDSDAGILLGVEGVGATPSMGYTTLFTSRVVDRLPDRAAP